MRKATGKTARKTRSTNDCRPCRSLRVDRQIDGARQYERIAVRIDAALAAGTLVPDPDEPFGLSVPPIPYVEMRRDERAGRGLPDIFSFNFRCTACATRFNLSCDIYHGAGGHWRVLSD